VQLSRLSLLVMVASCYRGAADLSCKIRCAEGCPSGTSCVAGFCTSGAACAAPEDAAGPCGALGEACCATDPACGANASCVNGTCTECVTSVVFGAYHSCALEHDHTVWCAGRDAEGQLGDGGATASTAFVQATI